MDHNPHHGYTSPTEAFRMAADVIRGECDKERRLAMSQERWDRLNPDIRSFDYAASRMELLARRFDEYAGLAEIAGDLPSEEEPPLVG